MSDVLIATIGGLGAMLGWGASDWLAARSSKKYSSIETNFAIQTPGLFVMIAVYILTKPALPQLWVIFQIGLIGIMFTVAYLLMIKAFTTGSVGIVAPLVNSFPLTTLILVIVFGNNIFSILQIVSMVLVILGVFLLAYQKNINSIPLRTLHKETLLALSAAAIWGVSFFISDSVVTQTSWQIIMLGINIVMVCFATFLLYLRFRFKTLHKIKDVSKNKSGIMSGLIVTMGSIAFYAASEKSGGVLVAAVIASSSPLVASALSAIYDKERLNLIKRLGAVIVVGGIILLNIL